MRRFAPVAFLLFASVAFAQTTTQPAPTPEQQTIIDLRKEIAELKIQNQKLTAQVATLVQMKTSAVPTTRGRGWQQAKPVGAHIAPPHDLTIGMTRDEVEKLIDNKEHPHGFPKSADTGGSVIMYVDSWANEFCTFDLGGKLIEWHRISNGLIESHQQGVPLNEAH